MKLLINDIEVEVSKDELTQGIEKGEFAVKTDLQIFKNEDFETLKKNISDTEYKKGKVAGEEMLIKQARETFGLEFEGKTLDKLGEAFKMKVLKEASIEPDKKVKELTSDIEKLRLSVQDWESKYNSLSQETEKTKKQIKIDSALMSKLNKDVLSIPVDDVISLIKSKNIIDFEGESIVIKKDGEVLKNKLQNPITLDEWIPEVIKPYTKQTQGGGGGGDQTKPMAGSIEAFTEEMKANGIKPTDEKYQKEMQKRIKEGTLSFK